MAVYIRPYHPSDLTMLYKICLLTGDSGKDATPFYTDQDLLGHFYAAPYAALEPELCFVAVKEELPIGYILGTKNSSMFYERCETDWFPPLRLRYTLPSMDDASRDAAIIRRIHEGHKTKNELLDYPAHLHIDILPQGQGHGLGRSLMNTFISKLKELNVPALHLEVGKKNPGAIQFYEKLGFQQIADFPYSIAFGITL